MIRLALTRLRTAAAAVGLAAFALNSVLRISQSESEESVGYLFLHLQEQGWANGIAWFTAATLVMWVALLVVALVDRPADYRWNPSQGSATDAGPLAVRSAEPSPRDDDAVLVPEWLEDKASDASTLIRVLVDTIDLRFQREYPHVLRHSGWRNFRAAATVGGCACLALRLHVEVPESYRTPVELALRSSLNLGLHGAESLYEDCVRSVREALLALDRKERLASTYVLTAMWVFGRVADDTALLDDAHLVGELAYVYQNETRDYWASLEKSTALPPTSSAPQPRADREPSVGRDGRIRNVRTVNWRFAGSPPCGTLQPSNDGTFAVVAEPGYSPLHALFHLRLRTLPEMQQYGEVVVICRAFEEWAGVKDGLWSPIQEELLVRQMELYAIRNQPRLSAVVACPEGPVADEIQDVLAMLFALKALGDEGDASR